MSLTWQSDTPPASVPPKGVGWVLVGVRLLPILCVLGTGLALMLVMRLVERPLCGASRPLTPWITVVVCRAVLRLLGMRWRVEGTPAPAALLVSNHISWLDIFALNAVRPLYFVAKSEVSGWPGINWLARATGTVFIARDPRKSRDQAQMLAERLALGHRLLLFPEGTSTDGHRVLPFRTSMFGATGDLPHGAQVQPLSLVYVAPRGQEARFYGWWGDMDLVPNVLQVLAARPQGQVTVCHHAPLAVAAYPDRKVLAKAAETAVRDGLSLRHHASPTALKSLISGSER